MQHYVSPRRSCSLVLLLVVLPFTARSVHASQHMGSYAAQYHDSGHLARGDTLQMQLPERAEVLYSWPVPVVREDLPALPIRFHGQDLEDRYALEHFFWNTTHGVFLEMGAVDGVDASNSLMFSRALGWQGLLIEPSPESFQELVKNRKHDVCVHAAVCSSHKLVHFLDDGPRLSTTRGIFEFMSERFRQTWHAGRASTDDLPVVPCIPLTAILQKVNLYRIDFFSLDVEGAEYEVLKTLNFDEVAISVLLLEAQPENPEREEAIRQLLEKHGFALHNHVGRNSWYVHGSFLPSVRPMAGSGQ